MAAWSYEISLLVFFECFSTLKEQFRISARPCNILYFCYQSRYKTTVSKYCSFNDQNEIYLCGGLHWLYLLINNLLSLIKFPITTPKYKSLFSFSENLKKIITSYTWVFYFIAFSRNKPDGILLAVTLFLHTVTRVVICVSRFLLDGPRKRRDCS